MLFQLEDGRVDLMRQSCHRRAQLCAGATESAERGREQTRNFAHRRGVIVVLLQMSERRSLSRPILFRCTGPAAFG